MFKNTDRLSLSNYSFSKKVSLVVVVVVGKQGPLLLTVMPVRPLSTASCCWRSLLENLSRATMCLAHTTMTFERHKKTRGKPGHAKFNPAENCDFLSVVTFCPPSCKSLAFLASQDFLMVLLRYSYPCILCIPKLALLTTIFSFAPEGSPQKACSNPGANMLATDMELARSLDSGSRHRPSTDQPIATDINPVDESSYQ